MKKDKKVSEYLPSTRSGLLCAFWLVVALNSSIVIYIYKYNKLSLQDIDIFASVGVFVSVVSLVITAISTFISIYQIPSKTKKALSHQISSAPGTNLLKIVDFIYHPQLVEDVFKPIISDWRLEYFNALHQARHLKARWISIRYIIRFGLAMGLSKVFSVVRSIAGR